MKTAEPKAAEWISEAIGKVEIERLKETKFDGSRSGKNFTVDRQIEPLVMGSEIGGLDDRHAYLKLGNNVARFDFDYLDLPTPTAGFVPRKSADGEMSFDPDTLKPRSVQTVPPSATESEVEAGNGAPLAHKRERQTGTALQLDEQSRIDPEVGPQPEDQENVRLPRGSHHVGLQATDDEFEHAVHPGIF